MRNAQKDAVQMAARRKAMLESGFKQFSERGIESVAMQDIADACNIGIATLYRYFPTKLDLVIAIGTHQWVDYFDSVEKRYRRINGPALNAVEEYAFFLDSFIDLYANRKDLLLFNRNFDSYVQHEMASADQMRPYNEAVDKFAVKFHVVYAKAEADGTLRTDMPEERLFVSSMYTMLEVAAKLAEGLVYPANAERDHSEDLVLLRDILLGAYSIRK